MVKWFAFIVVVVFMLGLFAGVLAFGVFIGDQVFQLNVSPVATPACPENSSCWDYYHTPGTQPQPTQGDGN